ncbi:hypothetical protein [Pseudomonas oryzae]|uniref:Uncharacterized protein n=1 Tax=Pseudomonas oryzae TaxID=1392877 RepID=A0A1H1R2X9_9PSED|nr:hypothetical protein [Pseudomonas oryzae]SDS30063.1 hypothetical protein SAMN05216221_1512 [Pseudomonas oryzae]
MNLKHLFKLTVWLAALWLAWIVLSPSPQTPRVSGDLTGGGLRIGNHRLQALQPFQLEEAVVLGREDYRFDRGAQLSPTDLALGWGPMADPAISSRIDIRQSNRWYYWRTDDFPIPRREIETHSANMHMIPGNAEVASVLGSLQAGARIRLSGQLIRVEGDDGFRWVSSLSREDTGNGACELVWVEELAVLP